MKGHEVYGGDFIKATRAGTIVIDGKELYDPTLTVKGKLDTTTFEDGKKQRVASFYETEMTLGLNKTNWDSIASIAQNDDDDFWDGTKIQLFAVPESRSQTGQAIRVRKPRDGGQVQPQSPQMQQQATAFNGPTGGYPATSTDKVLGPLGDARLGTALKEKNLHLGHLRAWLLRHNPMLHLTMNADQWPASLGPKIKMYLESLSHEDQVKDLEELESDIPF